MFILGSLLCQLRIGIRIKTRVYCNVWLLMQGIFNKFKQRYFVLVTIYIAGVFVWGKIQ